MTEKAVTTAIVKYQPAPEVDPLILSYWLMFCRAPKKAEPEIDGSFFIGEIGEAPEKQWSRWCPYALAKPRET
jgi:hypothetical protein